MSTQDECFRNTASSDHHETVMEKNSMVDCTKEKLSSLKKSSVTVRTYTRGDGHPSAAHVVSGFKYRVFRTLLVVLGHMCMGVFVELAGPCLPDLKHRVSANYEEISRSLVARSVGYLLSSLTFGVLVDRLSHHVELLLGVSFLLGAAGTVITAWSYTLWIMALSFHLQGWGMGAVDLCNNFLILRLWGKEAAPAMYALHVGFGLGAVVSPQLARHFITGAPQVDDIPKNGTGVNITWHRNYSSVTAGYNETLDDVSSDSSRVEIPYMIAAVYTLLYVVLNVGVYVYERYTLHKISAEVMVEHTSSTTTQPQTSCLRRFVDAISPGSCTGGRTTFGFFFFVFIFLYYLNIVGGERAYGKFLYSFAVDGPLRFTKDEAANLASVWWFCFMGGRALAILYSKWVPTHISIFIFLSLQIVCGALLTIWGSSVKLVLWIMTGVFGFSLAPLFPAGMTWANLYVEMKGKALSVLILGSATGGMVYQWLSGYLFDSYGPPCFAFIALGYAIIFGGVFIILFCITVRQGQRFDVVKLDCPEIASLADNEDGGDPKSSKHDTN